MQNVRSFAVPAKRPASQGYGQQVDLIDLPITGKAEAWRAFCQKSHLEKIRCDTG